MDKLTAEQRETGSENFYSAIGSEYTRRDFLKGTIAAGVVSGAGLGAMYFGYEKSISNPVRIGVIGTGDEGSVLIGAHNPNFTQIKAIADIRPYNVYRAFHGDWSSPNAIKARPGIMAKYDYKSEEEARQHVKVYEKDYKDLLNDKDIEAVVIALPLHMHAQVAIQAMRAGKHVLTEKLMGHSVAECKEMARVSRETGRLCATGHQRHYSILYDNSLDLVRRNLIGTVHGIRAQWHRLRDTWSPPLPDDKDGKLAKSIARMQDTLKTAPKGKEAETLQHRIDQMVKQLTDKSIEPKNYGYEDKTLDSGHLRTAMEELIRWRLWQRTGGGLMAELGSHQLDAASLFISAVYPLDEKTKKPVKIHPLAVTGIGGKYLYDKEPRECEDHVYCTFEFPGPEYFKPGTQEIANPNKKIVVVYSSINGNGFGGYGEVVMGEKGTLILENEKDAMLYKDAETGTKVGVAKGEKGPILDTTASGSAAAAVGKAAIETGPVSKGYTEEIEHWAWCIRHFDEKEFKADPDHYVNLPLCHPKVAMGDAIIALTSNEAIHASQKSGGNPRIEFKPEWFEIENDATPEGVKPDITQERYKFA
ncbi:MAG TPA: Gfo/Idh/MocA family oxidoreductase [Pirellulales bacterium]|jgi:predicted dehydrogenase|nr:Gfo/Idh/MocA family oxidoreductase [Pirellulales bacterium]